METVNVQVSENTITCYVLLLMLGKCHRYENTMITSSCPARSFNLLHGGVSFESGQKLVLLFL